MKYRVILDALMCDRFINKIFNACDLGIESIGQKVKISFLIDERPTDEAIKKIIECHLQSKNNANLDSYFTNVKLNRIELLKEEE